MFNPHMGSTKPKASERPRESWWTKYGTAHAAPEQFYAEAKQRQPEMQTTARPYVPNGHPETSA